jgi:hypothetical protein
LLNCRHVCKTCAFHDALQAGKQKEVHRIPLIWRLQALDQGSTVDYDARSAKLLTLLRAFISASNILKQQLA